MKSLVLHIEYLIQRYDCVILPGYGAFVAKYSHASFDYENGLINPPMRTISFNTDIQHDDGVLANSISRSEQIGLEEAKKILQQYLDEIKNSLIRSSNWQAGKLGNLISTDKNELKLIPSLSQAEKAKLSGNPVINIKLQDKDGSEEKAHSSIDSSLENDSPDITDTERLHIPEGCSLRIVSDKNYYLPINKIFARCAASVLIVAAIALSFFVPNTQSDDNREVKASLNPAETLSSKKELNHIVITDIPKSVDDPEKCDSTSEQDEEVNIVTHPSGYYLVVGTFSNLKEAELFADKRSGGEYSLQIIERKGLWRVSAGHGDYQTLRSILKSSEFRAAFSEAWVWDADKK